MTEFSVKGIDDIVYFDDSSDEYQEYLRGVGDQQSTNKLWLNYIGHDDRFFAGVWSATKGEFPLTLTKDEHSTIISGSMTITDENGKSKTFVAGDTFLLPVGLKSTMTIKTEVKKIFTAYKYEEGGEFETKTVDDIINITDEADVMPYKTVNGTEQQISNHYLSPQKNFQFGWRDSQAGHWEVNFMRDEVCEFVRGSAKITDTTGKEKVFNAGDKAIFPAGFTATIDTNEYVRRVFAFRKYPR